MISLIKRVVFGAIYVALVLSAVLLDLPELYIPVFSIFIFIGICEYSVLVSVNRTRPLRTLLDAGAATYLYVIISMLQFGILTTGIGISVVPYILYLCYIFVRAIYSDRDLMPTELSKVLLGQIYLLIPMLSANALGPILLVACIGIWSNDTGAFVAGSIFGKRKLFPSVSPNKSWEGFFGGLLASVALSVLIGKAYISEFSITYVLIGIIISVAATWGDLFESMLKRQAGVKDSGSIIPGHGGILDRIDSMLFVFPALLALKLIFLYW